MERDNGFKKYLPTAPNYSLFLSPTNPTEIVKYVNSIESTSSSIDDISPIVIKHSVSFLLVPLTHIFNLSLKTGIFPEEMKKAKVIPFHKSGDRTNINNYRPISILPAFSKILEKIIARRLVNYLEKYNFLSSSQHGYRSNHSTESALLQFVSNVNKFLDERYYVVGLFLDLSKAFDSLDHKILVHKLSNIGIRGSPLHLFHSYISNRKQAVFCNNVYSSTKIISSGVPQGSVLGPIPFLIYINDIVCASTKFKFTIYADDTTLLMADKNLQNLHTNLSNEISRVHQWIKVNRLKLNVNKTNYILFQNRSVRQCLPPVLHNGERIERVQYTKFLGVVIDEHLDWSQHIKEVCLKLSRTCGILYKIRKQLTTDAMLSIYYTLAYPFLYYCISVWGCTWPSFLNTLVVA